jgi:hypothetical protein
MRHAEIMRRLVVLLLSSEKDSCGPKDGKWDPERGMFAEPLITRVLLRTSARFLTDGPAGIV